MDELGASPWLMSLSITLTCAAEIPVFHYAGSIIQYVGLSGSVDIVLAAFVVRLLAYSSMRTWPTLWLVLLVEPMHGLTFGLAWALGTEFAKDSAPPGLEATMQSTFQSCYFGLGMGLGALIGGIFYDAIGPAACFAGVGAVIAVGWGGAALAEAAFHCNPSRCSTSNLHQQKKSRDQELTSLMQATDDQGV
jgi:predicted MFS family arabinose efflux permease